MPICQICGKELKNPKSKGHVNSKFHKNALKKQGKTLPVDTKTTLPRKSISVTVPSTGLENRINLLEDQVKFIMTKLDAVDVRLASLVPTITSLKDISTIKMGIKRLIPPGESMTIDELIKSKELQNVEWRILEKTLLDLVDDEVFDVSAGKSKKKIAGNIGRLIRR
jgi:hypothetical protein